MPRQNCLSKSAALNKVREGNTIISESVISLQIATQCRTDIYTGMLIFMLVLLCFLCCYSFSVNKDLYKKKAPVAKTSSTRPDTVT